MDNKTDPNRKSAKPAPKSRDDRLKAALKANLQRRKAQARARSASDKGVAEDE
ncbi:hypothetical protein [Celeribacter neptunius]|uniref:Uncharacterized protein n=1 Tax=Celeribacter neptunius TaxID=588602 RepID=A0A1I3TXV7_9RHOB|nr:hypothetical protein [Celeribacter neptunius]SFJ75119.1 hypothetical protein SAMN04487991_2908 [Celeribacter neptunius]